ncbi:MAG TPA: hypothetical protein H9894_09690 [Candidatus Desulfovibrio intestinipullorum]|uniref:Rpn family recombination-promoting nuclease/putative transposase n=1 Tax=Candidatus Desulfovibrio intestinipullorum TaxID=2838536 RepID=A0A9D1PZ90_9BACT|nr:hypothetical protein [Candidatus Desulfovibrio intestinipullorum]
MRDSETKTALEAEQQFLADMAAWHQYEQREKYYFDLASMKSDSRKEGERKATLKIARRMLSMNMSLEEIHKATNLPLSEILSLRDQMS